MSGIQFDQSARPRRRLQKIAVCVALLTGLAGAARTFGQDDAREHVQNARDESSGRDDRDDRDERDDRGERDDRKNNPAPSWATSGIPTCWGSM